MAKKKEEEKVPEQKNGGYKVFSELSEEEVKDLLFYEEFVAQVTERYITSFTIKDIKKKYDGCTFPPFVLNTMKIIRKSEKLVYFE